MFLSSFSSVKTAKLYVAICYHHWTKLVWWHFVPVHWFREIHLFSASKTVHVHILLPLAIIKFSKGGAGDTAGLLIYHKILFATAYKEQTQGRV